MRLPIHSPRLVRGFSLVELMVVVAIIGILVGIALPRYQDYVIKANRASAKQYLLSVANKQEQYLLDNRGYAGPAADETAIYNLLKVVFPPELSGKYTCSISSASSSAYQAICTAEGSQLSDGNLTINQLGEKTGKW